jgi:hypothetical protein
MPTAGLFQRSARLSQGSFDHDYIFAPPGSGVKSARQTLRIFGSRLAHRLIDLPDRQRLRLPHVHLDQTLDVALRRLSDHPLLPVVNRAQPGKREGVGTLGSIMEAYQVAYSAGVESPPLDGLDKAGG